MTNVVDISQGVNMRANGPQIEDGYTRIANELLEAVTNAHVCPITLRQLRLVLAVIRKTYGFQKRHDRISDGQLAAETGLSRQNVNQAKRQLLAYGVLEMKGNQVGVNKRYAEWDFSQQVEKDNLRQTRDSVSKPETKSVSKSGTHKRKKEILSTDVESNAQFAQTQRKAFEVFYNAGLPKKDRKRAEEKFKRIAKNQKLDVIEFAEYLADDIAKRIAADQQGIDRLHPTTYLNNERWLDDIEEPKAASLPDRPGVPVCPHADLLKIWNETCGPIKGAAPNLLDWQGTKSAEALAERWAEFYNAEINGRVRYDSVETGLEWWRMALGAIAEKQDFRSADIDIWSVFYKGRFGRAANGKLCRQGDATR